MQAKIIPFPKHSIQYHTFYYIRQYFDVFLQIIAAWTFIVLIVIEEQTSFVVGVGFGVWLAGMVLIVEYIITLGEKRKLQEEQRRIKRPSFRKIS